MLRFAWSWMAIPEEELADVFFHGESAGAGFVVPFKINTCVFPPLPVSGDRVVFLKCAEAKILDVKAHEACTFAG